jgi:murein L,D-transpeptidase YcbB/YkuD
VSCRALWLFVIFVSVPSLGLAQAQVVWTDEARFTALLSAVEGSYRHGLMPRDYHSADLVRLTHQPGPERDRVANEALALLLTHLHRGKVNAGHYRQNKPGPADQTLILESARAENLARAIDLAAPSQPLYRALVSQLTQLRQIEAKGGWVPIGKGTTLSKGMSGPRVAAIAMRLRLLGDLSSQTRDDELFDETLVSAVKTFQRRMGLDPSGQVGAGVLEELNRPIAQRIRQLRVNMDRARALMGDLPSRFMVVNIAGFDAYLIDDNRIIWRSKVQVGKPFRQTPQLRSAIDQIVLNPTWTVPPTILKEDIAPAAAKDPSLIAKRGFTVTDQKGRVIDPRKIDWTGGLPYRLRQAPGPDNAMGRVKFLFPNPYSVYLHDTPAKALFASRSRAFSSGCVRLDHPIELADLILTTDRKGWTSTQTQVSLETMKTQTLQLGSPVTILLAYWTAWVDPEGVINFRRDIYGLDNRWAKALDHYSPRK